MRKPAQESILVGRRKSSDDAVKTEQADGLPQPAGGRKEYKDDDGQVMEAHSISAGLDYPGVGPEHSFYKDSGRAEYVSVTDREALQGFTLLCETEGIIPALESAHAVYYAANLAKTLDADKIVLVNLSGRGDKDMDVVREALGEGKA